MIVRVSIVLKRIVVDNDWRFNNLSESHLQSHVNSGSVCLSDCHRTLNHYKTKLQQKLDKLQQLIPTDLLNTVLTISDKRADKTTEQCHTKTQLTRLQHAKDRKRQKPDDN